jgi:DNA mismatch repair protein MutS
VIRRAGELLAELEGQQAPERRTPPARNARPLPAPDSQMALFDIAPHPAIELLRRLNVNELTPIEALTKLYELQRLASERKQQKDTRAS